MFPSDSNFESNFTFETPANPLPDALPFHMLFLGDWCGHSARSSLNERRPLAIDRDNFDEVLRRLDVTLDLDFQGDGQTSLHLQFAELEDFHPDNLFQRVSLFSDLRDVRRRLSNSDTFNRAATEVRSWFNVSEERATSEIENQTDLKDVSDVDSNELLDLILSKPPELSNVGKHQISDNSELGRLISKIVSPHLIKIDENEQSKLVAAVDEATGELMRKILHHPQFQALEAAWRGLYLLIRRLETDVDLKVFMLDVSKDELLDKLKSIRDLSESVFYRLLVADDVEKAAGQPWAVIAGNYSFGLNVDDVAALIRLGKLASAANAPFVSHIRPEMFGIKSFSANSGFRFSEESPEGKLWTALRDGPESGFIGLSPMRFLVRLPYGTTTDSTETFFFEEFTGKIDHEQFLWSNPVFICSLLLAQSYRLYSWEMGSSLQREIDKLPTFIYHDVDEAKTLPCAEIVLTDILAERILENGLIPLISFRDSDRVRIGRFQSISSHSKKLAGRW